MVEDKKCMKINIDYIAYFKRFDEFLLLLTCDLSYASFLVI